MDERVRFVIRLKDGESMASLCRESGISSQTGVPPLPTRASRSGCGLLQADSRDSADPLSCADGEIDLKPTFLLALASMLLLAACGGKPTEPRSEAAPKPAAPAGFEQTLELQGVRFQVSCPNSSSINKLTITPSGLETGNAPIVREVDGTVHGAEVADLNADGSPEVYVYVTSAGSGSYGSLVAYSANKRKSLSEIYLPPVAENPKVAVGYMGHDEFAVVENSFVQRFPIYRKGDTNAQPSGKTRQLQYKLKRGEAGWVLRLDRTVEF